MAELRIPIITEFKGKKAFKEANTATSTLQKGVKKLGAQLAPDDVQDSFQINFLKVQNCGCCNLVVQQF